MNKSKQKQSRIASVGSSGNPKHLPSPTQFLRPFLPSDWGHYFQPRRAGRYWGLSIICPVCHTRPPSELEYGSRKWRWLSVHLASEHETSVHLVNQR